jgi:hypothetical protein
MAATLKDNSVKTQQAAVMLGKGVVAKKYFEPYPTALSVGTERITNA